MVIGIHTAIAIIVVITLIIRFKVDPIISLIVSCLYLGLASGVGFTKTVEAITGGFGDIMAKIGLLIGFGVLIGALLHAMGAFKTMVEALVRVVPGKRLPYALAGALSTIFPSIYVDVQVVLASPVARSSAPMVGERGLPYLAGALGTGIFCGYVFVIPGLAAISIAGLLGIPLGTYMLFGIVIGPLTALLTVWLFGLLLRMRYWSPEQDEDPSEAMLEEEAVEAAAAEDLADGRRRPSLGIAVLPIIVPLLMIAFGAFADLGGFSNQVIAFFGNANIALFIGLVGAYVMARRNVGSARTSDAFSTGLQTTGEILLVTGVGGSLGAVIKSTGLAKELGGLFTVNAAAPLLLSVLLAWFIAALLHLAIGSVSVAAITAAGIIAPILGQIDVAPIVIGLAIASGSLFALQVNSNFFWMYKALLGLSTRGALKTMTVVTSMASIVSLPLVLVASLIA